MGRRRGRGPAEYSRREPTRDPYDYIMIVCEGGKTEPNYFRRLRAVHKLSNANVEITPADGTDPVSVVKNAIKRHLEHDRIYCVFDRDGHPNFNEALDIVRQSPLGKKGILKAITSVPCFEVWVLLHFAYSTAPFNKTGGDSPCARVLKALKEHFPEYAKGHREIYDVLAENLEAALKNAAKLVAHNVKAKSNNPATQVHDLVDYLRKLKS